MSGGVTHACPPPGPGLMPCCRRTPFEVPRTDRITVDESEVTCPGVLPTRTVICVSAHCPHRGRQVELRARPVTDTTYEWPHARCRGCDCEPMVLVEAVPVTAVDGGRT